MTPLSLYLGSEFIMFKINFIYVKDEEGYTVVNV